MGKPCTVPALRELLSMPDIPPPLLDTLNSKKVGWLPKLRRRLVPIIDPGGTPSSSIESFPGKLTEAGFQDLEDLVGLDSSDFRTLTEALRIPRVSANKLLQKAKDLVGSGKKPLCLTLEHATGIHSLITTVKEAHNGNTVNKVTLVTQKVVTLINLICKGSCSPSGDSIAFDKLDDCFDFVTIGFFGDLALITNFLVRIGAFPEGKKLPESNGQAEIHTFITQFAEGSEMRGKSVMILVFVPGSTSFSNVQESDPACLSLRLLYSLCDRIFMCLSESMLTEIQQRRGEAETPRVVKCEVEKRAIKKDRCDFQKGFAQNLSLPSSDSPWIMIRGEDRVAFVCWEKTNDSTLPSPLRGQIPAYCFSSPFKDLLGGRELCTGTLPYRDKLALLRLLNPTATQSVEDGNKGPINNLQRVAKEQMKLILMRYFKHEWGLLQLEAPCSPSGHCADLDPSRLRDIINACLSKTTSVVFLFEEFCPKKTQSQISDFLSLTEHEMKQRVIQFTSDHPPRPHVPLSSVSSLGFEPHFISEITSMLKKKFIYQCEALIKEIEDEVCSNPDEFCSGSPFSLELETAIRKETPHTKPEKVTLTMLEVGDKANPQVTITMEMSGKVPQHMKFTVVELRLKTTDGRSNFTLAPPFCFDLDLAAVIGCFLLPEGKAMVVGVDTANPSNYLICIHHEGTRFLSSKLPKKGCISHVNFCAITRILVMCYSLPESSVCALKFNGSYSKYENLGNLSIADDADLAGVNGIFPVPEGQKVVVTFPTVAKLFDFEHRTISKLPQFDGPAFFLGPEFFVTVKPSHERESCVVSVKSCLQPSKDQNWETNLLNPHLLPSTLLTNFQVDGGDGAPELQLVQFNPTSRHVSTVVLCAAMKQAKFSLQMTSQPSCPSCLPDYLPLMLSKFPITAVCDIASEAKTHKLTVIVPSATPEAKRLISQRLGEYKEKLVGLFKTLGTADKFFTEPVTCSIDQGWIETEPLQPTGFGTWLKTLISLVPVQIARVDNNCLVLCNNKSSSQGNDMIQFAQTQHSVAEGISFGLLDAIFSSCFNKPVLVVTSMGKQSTGKSYTLNHLLGVLFDISGGRCTDGCWMSVREYSDYLIVALDFEGLCSPERSEQEDILLSLLNASVSNMTLFKTEFTIDRETERMFRNFQEGVGMLKGDDKLFKGCFTLMVKDVSERDIASLTTEFKEKFNSFVETNQGQNFLSQMFPGMFTMIMCSPLGTSGYTESLQNCAEILQKQTPQFHSGEEFSSMLKLILAKLHLKDWSSLLGKDMVIVVRMLQEQLPWAVHFGRKSQAMGHQGQLVNLSTGEVVSRSESVTVSGISIPIPNFDLQADREADFTRIRDEFKSCFQQNLPTPAKQANFRSWHSQFRNFVHQVIESRKRHVRDWVCANTNKSPGSQRGFPTEVPTASVPPPQSECPEVKVFWNTVDSSLRQLDALEHNTTAMDLTSAKLSALIAGPRAHAPIRLVTKVATYSVLLRSIMLVRACAIRSNTCVVRHALLRGQKNPAASRARSLVTIIENTTVEASTACTVAASPSAQINHAAAHGNMIKTQFVSSGKDIDLDGRLYGAGEPGVAELCNMFCNKLGRHIHILPCTAEGNEPCSHTGEGGIRHATATYLPNPDSPKDELTHKGYWNAIKFRDPCTPEHRDIFKLCNFQCTDNSHSNERCRCMLPLWHEPCALQANEQQQFPGENVGYATSDGHIFPKKHGPPENLHIVFCLDISTSMSKRNRWETLKRGVEHFISARNKPKDAYSIVLFHGKGILACDRVSQEEAKNHIKREPKFGGDTKFSSGLAVAYRKLRDTKWDEYRAALIFMSDGEDENSEWEDSMLNIKHLAEENPRLVSTFVIGIGDGFNTKKLRSVAETGGAHFLTVDAVCENLTAVLQGIDAEAQLVALVPALTPPTPPPNAQRPGAQEATVPDRSLRSTSALTLTSKSVSISASRPAAIFSPNGASSISKRSIPIPIPVLSPSSTSTSTSTSISISTSLPMHVPNGFEKLEENGASVQSQTLGLTLRLFVGDAGSSSTSDVDIMGGGAVCLGPDLSSSEAIVVKVSEQLGMNEVVGLDIEWSNEPGASNVALIQLCGEATCVLLCVETVTELPLSIAALLKNPNVIKSGVGIHSDTKRIWSKFRVPTFPCVDLQLLALQFPQYATNGVSLKALSQSVLGVTLYKERSLQCGNWALYPLSDAQQAYAAMDAWVSRQILVELHKRHGVSGDTLTMFCSPFIDLSPKHLEAFVQKRIKPESGEIDNKGTSAVQKEDASISKKDFKGVCQLQTRGGVILHDVDEKRLHWYLSRGLAEMISADPPQAKLLFDPVPRLPENQLFIWTKEANCVVCDRADSLCRFSVVPPKYRKYIPPEYKDMHSPNVVLLCPPCHTNALDALTQMDKILEKESGLPLSALSHQKFCEQSNMAFKAATALKNYRAKMNPEKIQAFYDLVKSHLISVGSLPMDIPSTETTSTLAFIPSTTTTTSTSTTPTSTPTPTPTLTLLPSTTEPCVSKDTMAITLPDDTIIAEHVELLLAAGKPDVSKLDPAKKYMAQFTTADQLEAFCHRWRQQFLSVMKPKHLPSYWD
ncbi:e3 ubiquitin-protein ligase trip12 [Pelomyxa schiedti]|nr:e3 ubiquitin-protein ligase trip12 [Pelomyxa schiedti]